MIKEGLPAKCEQGESGALNQKKPDSSESGFQILINPDFKA